MKLLSALAVSLITTTCFAGQLTTESAKQLLSKSGCLTCHSLDTDKIGPAYASVAKRYAAPSSAVLAYLKGEKPADYLFKKVRTGTKVGVNKNWIKSDSGKAFAVMPAHSPTKVSDQNLKDLINYILAIK